MSSVASRAVRKMIGSAASRSPQAPGDVEAVDVGQHHVEHHQVGPHRRRGRHRLAPAGADAGLEALVAERGAQQLRDARLVVDDQDAGIGRRSLSLLHTRAVRSAAHHRAFRRSPETGPG